MTQSTVLILGAHGRLGSALVAAFSASGWRVIAQSRSPSPTKVSGTLTADMRDVGHVVKSAQAAGRVNVVIHAANVIYTRWATEAIALNDAAISIAKALDATLMLPGNVYNFGVNMPEQLRSDTPQNALTSKGIIRVNMERALAAAAAQGIQAIVIRAGDFFGSGVGSWLDLAIAKDVQKGKLTYPGPLAHVHTWAYVPDLAATFVRVAEARKTLALFENIHFAGHAVTGYEFVQSMQRVLQRTLKLGALPWWLIRALGVIKPAWRDLAEMSYLWQRPHRLVTNAAHAHLMAPTTPLERALQQSLVTLYPSLQCATANPSSAVAG